MRLWPEGLVHMVQRPGGGGNVGVFSGQDGILLVDSLFAPLADRLIDAVKSISEGNIRFLINTHVHPDHIGGNGPLAEQDVLIFAHDNVRVRALERLRFPRGGGRFAPQPQPSARPIVTYNDAVSFHFNGEEVRAFLARRPTPPVIRSSTSPTLTFYIWVMSFGRPAIRSSMSTTEAPCMAPSKLLNWQSQSPLPTRR